LVLFTNKKSHLGFRLVTKSVTLNNVMVVSFWGLLCESGWRYSDTF